MRLEDKIMVGVLAASMYCGAQVYDIKEYNKNVQTAYVNCQELVPTIYCSKERPPYKDHRTYLLGALFGFAVMAGSAAHRIGYGPR